MHEIRTIPTDDGDMRIAVAHPEGDGPFPVVLSFHHGPGLDDASRQAMSRISEAGYYVVAHDRYHRHGTLLVLDLRTMMGPDASPEDRRRLQEVFFDTTEDLVQRDVEAVLGSLASDPVARRGPMGCVGYCIGARSVLSTLARHRDAFNVGILFHPSFCVTEGEDSPHRAVEGFPGFLYVGIGELDQMQSATLNRPLIDAVQALGPHGLAEVLPGANHGFAVPGAAYHEEAAARAYGEALTMLARGLT